MLHHFDQPTEGAAPIKIIQLSDRNFYGLMTLDGEGEVGTLYKLARDGGFLVLHHFNQIIDGGLPDELAEQTTGKFLGLKQSARVLRKECCSHK